MAWRTYKQYDPKTEGFGSAQEWAKAAESLGRKGAQGGNARGKARVGNKARASTSDHDNRSTLPAHIRRDLQVLLLETMPQDTGALKRAYHNVLFIVHPDYGGTEAACIAATDAYERLLDEL
jgi:hypothetical protein